MDLIVRNARLAHAPDSPPVDIGVSGGRIAAIEPALHADGPVFDAGGCVVCGGLVETHIHLDKSNIIDRCAPEEGRQANSMQRVAAVKQTFTVEDVYERASRTLEKCIRHGATRMRTHLELDGGVEMRSFEAIEKLRRDYAWAIDLEVCVFPQEGLTNNPRSDALLALQAKIGHGKDIDGWLAARGVADARRLWQTVDIEPGWEDALEAVLRERLNALHLADLDAALSWVAEGSQPPSRVAAYADAADGAPAPSQNDALFTKLRIATPTVARVLADGLHGVRCRRDLAAALADRGSLASGETFVTPQGHRVGAQSVLFFAPDSELHGVLARQRELTELAHMIEAARVNDEAARGALDAVERELQEQQSAWHRDSLALASQQRRCHDLELELVQLRQAAEAASRRRQ